MGVRQSLAVWKKKSMMIYNSNIKNSLPLDIFIPHRDHKPRLSSRHNVFHSSFSVFLNLFFCFEEQDFDSDDPSESASSLPIGVSASLLPISASNAFSFSKLLVSIMIYHVTFYNIFNLILLYLLIIVFILSSFLVFVSAP